MPFLAGIFFTLFIFMLFVVIYLYNENSGLRREINDFQRKLSDIEIKIETPGDSVPEPQQKQAGNSETKTYLIPKAVETQPSLGSPNPYATESTVTTKKSTFQAPDNGSTGRATYTVPNKSETLKSIHGEEFNPQNSQVEDYTETKYVESGETKTYLAPKSVEAQRSQIPASSQTEPGNVTTKITEEYRDHEAIYSNDDWAKLKKNMSKSEVKSLLGNPDRVISQIGSDEYIYRYTSGDGIIYFNRSMKVVSWKSP